MSREQVIQQILELKHQPQTPRVKLLIQQLQQSLDEEAEV